MMFAPRAAVNGIADHVHLVVKLKQDVALSEILRTIKAGASAWIHKTFSGLEHLAWQRGYGAFTVSQSQIDRVRAYIQNQEEHHRNLPFQEEMIALLKAHGTPFTEEDLWD